MLRNNDLIPFDAERFRAMLAFKFMRCYIFRNEDNYCCSY